MTTNHNHNPTSAASPIDHLLIPTRRPRHILKNCILPPIPIRPLLLTQSPPRANHVRDMRQRRHPDGILNLAAQTRRRRLW